MHIALWSFSALFFFSLVHIELLPSYPAQLVPDVAPPMLQHGGTHLASSTHYPDRSIQSFHISPSYPSHHPPRFPQGLSRLHLLCMSDNGVSPAAMEGLAACMQQVKGLRLVTADSDDEQYADEYYNDEEYYDDEDYEDGAGVFGDIGDSDSLGSADD